MIKSIVNTIPFPGLILGLAITVSLSGCDWFCEKCDLPTSCGDETKSVEITDDGGNVIAYSCETTAPTFRCSDGTIQKDGGGGTVDRDDWKCESIRPTTVCGPGTSESDGGGGTVDRDGNTDPDGNQYPVEKTCGPPIIPPINP